MLFLMLPLPWSTNKLKRLGVHIRDGTTPPDDLPHYDDVMLWYNDLAEHVRSTIEAMNWEPLFQGRAFEVTARPKTIDMLRQKLQRERDYPLPSIQDVAGVRFEAEMTLDEQDAVVNAIAGQFGHDLESCAKDMRKEPHSGYRAVHLWLKLEARVEVQVRTHLQGQWANVYELAADLIGRQIRYNEEPRTEEAQRLVRGLRTLSTSRIAQMERDGNEIAQISLSLDEQPNHMKTRAEYRRARSRVDTLRNRYRSNEAKLRQQLTRLYTVFSEVRKTEGV